MQELQEEWRRALTPAGVRSDAAAWRLIDVLPGHPIISQPVAAEATGRTRPAIQQAIDQLVEVGVLHALTTGKRNRQWEAAGLLDLSAEFETLSSR